MKKVYIASPYTIGDIAMNVKGQLDAFDRLVALGFAPFAPLWSHYQHIVHPLPYHKWLELDLEWLEVCDCVLRLPGASKGADLEVEQADIWNKPIFKSYQDLIKWSKGV